MAGSMWTFLLVSQVAGFFIRVLHLPEANAQVVGGKPLTPSVLAAEDQGVEDEAVPIPMATLAQFEVLVLAYSLDEESTSGLPVGVAVEAPHWTG
ncbi:hypothetical protein Nepgr_012378 [Nepenthes gracilis]|uniref:Secreted protein n=1 Tax=Nepenthes gracilis TaxID=150966 RepID=A0AAD3SG11_NEPGR|nr:hypothetical protein Nepgr_012378 [Nepenthes gracilis]